jgi:hypothetical protein
MINERVIDLLTVSVLSFVISYQNKSGVKSSNEAPNEKVNQVLVVIKENHVVYCYTEQLKLFLDIFVRNEALRLLKSRSRISILCKGIRKDKLYTRA